MRVKIISDGTTEGTHIVNAETGEKVEMVFGFSINHNATLGVVMVNLDIIKPELDIEAEVV